MDTCTDMGGVPEQCRALTVLSDSEINRCTQKPVIDEVVEGSCKSDFTSPSFPTIFRSKAPTLTSYRAYLTDLRELPGCNPIQNGPNPATMVNSCSGTAAPTATAPIPTTTVVVPPNPTTTTVVNPAPTAPQGPAIPKYGQCGGNGVSVRTRLVLLNCALIQIWIGHSGPEVQHAFLGRLVSS